jgi:hypothetical protein
MKRRPLSILVKLPKAKGGAPYQKIFYRCQQDR